MLVTALTWLVPAACVCLALAGLAASLWRLRTLVAARRLSPVAALGLTALLLLRLGVMVAAVVAADRLLAGVLDRVLPPGPGLGGLAGRWGLQLLLSLVTLALWDAGPGLHLRRGVTGALRS